MTAQIGEILYIGDEAHVLYEEPLYPWLQANAIGFVSCCTACWRGYQGVWAVRDERLWLVELGADPFRGGSPKGPLLQSEAGQQREVDLADLFPGADGPVLAEWFTGELRIPRGKVLRPVHMGFGPLYERDLLIDVRAGRVVRTWERDNRAQGGEE